MKTGVSTPADCGGHESTEGDGVWRAAEAVVATWREWRARQMARSALTKIKEHDLSDAGLSTTMVDYELRQPFWRPLRDLRD